MCLHVKLNLLGAVPAGKRWEVEEADKTLPALPSTMLDLAKYPADAFSALLNMKKQDPVTTTKTQTQSETAIKQC